MLTKKDIILETIEYYEDNPVGYDNDKGSCCYYSKDGNICAVGRCMVNPEEVEGNFFTTCINDISYEENIDSLLKKEYRGHDVGFWSDLQQFHDEIIRDYKNKILSEDLYILEQEKLIKKWQE